MGNRRDDRRAGARKPKTMTIAEVSQHLRDGLPLNDDDLVRLPRTGNSVSVKCYLAMRDELMAEARQQLPDTLRKTAH
jgi:hypothetical protein